MDELHQLMYQWTKLDKELKELNQKSALIRKEKESMSYKFLEEKLGSYFETPDECLQVIQYLKDNRKKESSFVLKSSEITDDE